MLLQLVNLGSSSVFQDLTSLTVAGLYSSYLIAVTLLLYRRCTGYMSLFHDNSSDSHLFSSSSKSQSQDSHKAQTLTNTVNAPLTWGPWHIKGLAGIILNIFVCIFLSIAWFFSFWPTQLPTTGENMNYNVVVWGGVVLTSLAYYLRKGKEEYSGPIIEAVS